MLTEKLPNNAAVSSPLGVPENHALMAADDAEQPMARAAADGAAFEAEQRGNGAGIGWR